MKKIITILFVLVFCLTIGTSKVFATVKQLPVVSTGSSTILSSSAVFLYGNMISTGGSNAGEDFLAGNVLDGVKLATNDNGAEPGALEIGFQIFDGTKSVSTGDAKVFSNYYLTGPFSARVNSLSCGVSYTYKAFAKNGAGTATGNSLPLLIPCAKSQVSAPSLTWKAKLAYSKNNKTPLGPAVISSDGKNIVMGDSMMGEISRTLTYTNFTSNDGGVSWAKQKTFGKRGFGFDSIATSADGKKLIASGVDTSSNSASGPIPSVYISSDSGVTWKKVATKGGIVSSSADGKNLAYVNAVGNDAGILNVFTSNDFGSNWTKHPVVLSGIKSGLIPTISTIAMSSDGSKIAITTNNSWLAGSPDSSGYIYISKDSGNTWTKQDKAGLHAWNKIAMSSDGSKIFATTNKDYFYAQNNSKELKDNYNQAYLYTSFDGGNTWVAQLGAPDFFKGISSSSDGKRLVGIGNGHVYLSYDSGVDWMIQSEKGGIDKGQFTAISADGTKIAHVSSFGNLSVANAVK